MNDDIKKKTALLYILEILQKDSDHNNKLTRNDICRKLEEHYGMNIDRRAVSRNLEVLRAAGIDICEDARSSGVYIGARDFTDGELQLIIDVLRYSPYIPLRYVDDLIGKLSALGSVGLRRRSGNGGTFGNTYYEKNVNIFDTVENINIAICDHKKVSFMYTEYGLKNGDGELFGKTTVFGHNIILDPCAAVMRNGNYYLLGSYDGDDNIVAFRVDKICDLKITDDAAVGVTDGEPLNRVREYLFAHPYLHTGKTEQVYMKISIRLLDNVIDTFGKNISICMHDKFNYRVGLKVCVNDIVEWALQNAGYAEILSPDFVREKVKKRIIGMARDYGMDVRSDVPHAQARADFQDGKPLKYPYNLLSMIFEESTRFTDDGKAICDTLDSIFKVLSDEEFSIVEQIYKNGLSRENTATALGISVQELAMREANVLAKLSYSKNSIRLVKFTVK